MTDKNEKNDKGKEGKSPNSLYEKFDRYLNHVVVNAQAASIDAKVDCIYPESFVIGIIISGANRTTSTLSEMNVDLEKCLKTLKAELTTKKAFNESSKPTFENLKVDKVVHDAVKLANKIRSDLPQDSIGVHHMFLALLKTSDFIKGVFERENVSFEKFIKVLVSTKSKEPVESEGRTEKKFVGKALQTFCTDLTQLAKENKLDPIIAREKEIETAITVLCRRGKNNPILLGEAGVGKTAIIEGIAQRIVSKAIPRQLLNHKVYSLSLASLVAGTKYRGEFEERIQSLVNEIQAATDCILFIDEIHTLVGAGSGSGGSLDASNILKPFLARSDLRCIGATTLDDYKKYFAKDGALARRFQQIMVEEPSKEQVKLILLGLRSKLEEFHKLDISEDAIDSVINLSDRYLKDRNFPDKAIDILDMSCAKHAWDVEKKAVTINAKDIADVISDQCSVPLEVILLDDSERIIKIEEILTSKVKGQQQAIDSLCRVLKNAYSGIRNPDKPIGSFVFGGQSGTGKTHMSREVAKAVFGKESAFIRLDMTEFSEQHSVSKLIGSPPGYVGFQETDRFIDKIKRKPYSLVLLDELEKAHPDVIKLFLQVMAAGVMTDSSGNKADFKNIILIMTGNFGADVASKDSLGFMDDKKGSMSEKIEQQNKLIEYCKNKYGAEFVNRVDEFIPFMSLNEDDLKQIIKIRLEEVNSRIVSRKCNITFTDEVCDLLLKMSKDEHGKNATMLGRLISKKIEPCISDALLTVDKDNKEYNTIIIDVKDGVFVYRKKK